MRTSFSAHLSCHFRVTQFNHVLLMKSRTRIQMWFFKNLFPWSSTVLHLLLQNWPLEHSREGKLLNATCCFVEDINRKRGGLHHSLIRVPLHPSVAADGLKIFIAKSLLWPVLRQYVDTVHKKNLPNPATASFDNAESERQNLFTFAKTLVVRGCYVVL